MPDEFTSAELAQIQQRASMAQVGRMPTDLGGLARYLRLSSATREFVTGARHDVLRLCAELRTVTAQRDELAAAVEKAAAYQLPQNVPLEDWRELMSTVAGLDMDR